VSGGRRMSGLAYFAEISEAARAELSTCMLITTWCQLYGHSADNISMSDFTNRQERVLGLVW